MSAKLNLAVLVLMVLCLLLVARELRASGEVLGEVRLVAASKDEEKARVWVNGMYLGCLEELHRFRNILLLRGEHRMTIRQPGYKKLGLPSLSSPGNPG